MNFRPTNYTLWPCMFSKFQKTLRLRVLWNSLVRRGSRQNSCPEQLFEKLPSILKKDSNMDILMGSSQKYFAWLFFWNINWRMLPRIQTSICLEHQWTPLNERVENCREMSNCIKVILMLNNKRKNTGVHPI